MVINTSRNKATPINQKIKATEVMLINADGEKVGIVGIDEALKSAEKASLDLVQVSPNSSEPIVCKLLDYGKHMFDKKKNLSSSKTKVRKNTVKEIKFRPSTDVGDYEIKLKKIKSFILDGDKTKISIRFRGREILNSNLGLNLLDKIKAELQDIAQVDNEPSLEGRQLLMVLSPLKRQK
ncbi:translation initiation factor IF-3 [Gammaproteobacteria bacterium]|nr:translation initiation factor IF-3 [Gammaproteobacteria bacterium]